MHGAVWAILQQLIRQALVAGFIFVIVRRVSPAELGLIGIANIWNMFLYLFLELGFAAGLVQRKEIAPAQVAAAFLLNVAAGTLLMLLSVLFSGPISHLMNAPQAQPVIATVSISFLLSALASTQIALAQRELKFKAIALRDTAANSIAAAIGIVLALLDFGVWAVVANNLLLNLFLAAFVWRLTPMRIRPMQATRASFAEVWPYGSRVFAYSALKRLLASADSLLVGFFFGPEKLGLYNFAQRVTAAPTKAIQFGLATFLFPKASRLQDTPENLKDLFLRSFKILNYMILLFSALLCTAGVELLLKIVGRQWEPAVEVIRILVFLQLLGPVLVPLPEMLKATNRPHWLLNWTLLQTCLSAAAVGFSSRFGFRMAIIVMVAANWLLLPLLIWMTRQILQLSLIEFWRKIRLSYALSAITGALLFVVWSRYQGHQAILIAVSTLIGLLHLVIAHWLDPDLQHLRKALYEMPLRWGKESVQG